MNSRTHSDVVRSNWIFGLLNRVAGLLLAAIFYLSVWAVPVPLIERYFLGHPVAIAATVLFCIALAQLGMRFLALSHTRRRLASLQDEQLVPTELHPLLGWDSDHESSLQREEAAALSLPDRVRSWLQHIGALPSSIRQTALCSRIEELLSRQLRRGNSDQLSEDIRDIADREADADYDALQFVRIIVWAIPMLGFLGTVIGITQTLGGLDFTDGAAAVERLKSGLYVAFDTTALGLVLSVVAIFLQFPVEKSSRILLHDIETRVDHLLPAVLSEPKSLRDEEPIIALRQMTLEISKTVQDTVSKQAELWRSAIDEAHSHWQSAAHASSDHMQATFSETLSTTLSDVLSQHTDALYRLQREGAEHIDNRWQQWQTALSDNARILLSHQQTLLEQGELLADSHARASELAALQSQLDSNASIVARSVESIEHGMQNLRSTGNVADAMMILARAVEVLSDRLPETAEGGNGRLNSNKRSTAA